MNRPLHLEIRRTRIGILGLALAVMGLGPPGAAAQDQADVGLPGRVDGGSSALRAPVERYASDRAALLRRWAVPYSPNRRERLRAFYEAWRTELDGVDYESLDLEGRIDFVLLDRELEYREHLLDREASLLAEMGPLIPFADAIVALEERRRAREDVDPQRAAGTLAGLPDQIDAVRGGIEARLNGPAGASAGTGVSRIVALRAANAVDAYARILKDWYENYAGYDPVFTWWNKEPYGEASKALEAYAKFLREKVVGYEEGEDPPIVGDPIGAEGMEADLRHEMIAYSPAELIGIAEREFAWSEARMREASRELGYGDDWKAALEHVKTLHRPPGEQPALVRELAEEAVAFLRERDLVTVPPLAEEIWRIEMMSPERQKVAPFFLGGEVIQVAYPTDAMEHADKLMSMRGNNEHFSRATVFHELIPGHHLQGFMTERYHAHRQVFSTPFWGEGWALYWEMLLWDLGFPRTPEDRVGMLFWRMHRAARILFSLRFHLGEMTPQEAIDFLVDRVGHERANAEAEVRRSFNGSYSPLYQVAYMIGGLQIRALHRQLVQSGRMTNREFHDAILKGGRMPIEMVRARLLGTPLARDFEASWRFYEPPAPEPGSGPAPDREAEDAAPRGGVAPDSFLVEVSTDRGPFRIRARRAWAPHGADRFYELVREGYYDDARFHRVVPGFIVQWGLAGDPARTAARLHDYLPDDPVVASNTRGRIAYAFTEPGTRSTQVFINLVDNVRLDSAGFAPFGEVVAGMDIVDALYGGYGETSGGGLRRGDQSRIVAEGNAWLDREFPELDRLIAARVVDP